MASPEEELADEVYNAIVSAPDRTLPKLKLLKATTFYEKLGNSLLEKRVIDVALKCFSRAVIILTAHKTQYGVTESSALKASDMYAKIGECFSHAGLHDAAVYHFNLAISINPANLTAVYHLAIECWGVGDLEPAALLIHAALSTPRTSMHEQFEKLRFVMLNADDLAEASRMAVACRLSQKFQEALFPGKPDTLPAANITPLDDELPGESEGACGNVPEKKLDVQPAKQSKRSRSRSGSRSRSRTRTRSGSGSWSESEQKQFQFHQPTQPRKLSKKEIEKEATKRQKEIEKIRADILEKNAREEEKRKRKDSDKEKPQQSAPPLDLLHVLPGWGQQATKKDVSQVKKTQSNGAQASKKISSGSAEKASGPSKEPVPNGPVKEERMRPPIPPPFDMRFDHRLACKDCFVVHGYGSKGCQYRPNAESDHTCQRNILLVARKTKSLQVWVKVRPRPSMQSMKSNRYFGGTFSLCVQYGEGMPCNLGEPRCTFAHSEEEREIWTMDMNETKFSLSEFIKQHQRWALEHDTIERQRKSNPSKNTSSPMASTPSNRPEPSNKPSPSHESSYESPCKSRKDLPNQDLTCPFQLEEICGTCWQTFGSMAKQKGNNCHTIGVQHRWESHRAFLLRPEKELIRRLDPKRTARCYHWERKGNCSYGNACHFIHGDAEFKVWHWMQENKISELEDVVALSKKKALKSSQRAIDILKSQVKPTTDSLTSLIGPSRQATALSKAIPISSTTNPFCKVCNQNFSSQLEFDKHCTSRKHEKNLLTDREKPWHYRPPPWGGDTPKLCNGLNNNSCRFAGVPDMYNQCPYAHSRGELDEWKERTRYWKFKKSMMKDPEMLSYVHDIQREFATVQYESDMMMDELEDVVMEVTPDVTIFSSDKNCEQSWTFTLSCQNSDLKRVCLLHDESRLHFSLTSESRPDHSSQVEEGTTFLEKSTKEQTQYKVKVQFNAGLFGSFRQKVIFDFGKRPLLAVSLDMEVGNEFVRDRIIKLRKDHPVERWTSRTHRIIPFMPRKKSSAEKLEEDSLLCKYKPPDETVFSQDSLVGDLSHNNYIHMMHRLVEMEELGRAQIASKFNVTGNVVLTDTLPGGQGMQAPVGHLFGRVPLGEHRLSEDSDTGYLMLTGAVTAWVSLASPTHKEARPVVYEALVVCESNFGYDGRGKDHVYICLSKSCCTNLILTKGQSPSLEVQLQIDRLPFCRMHYGLDQLPDTNIVFPDLSRYNHAMANSTSPKIRSEYFNQTQLEIVQHMMAIRTQYTPPLVVYGPFGSGKTEILARATEEIVTKRPEARILICALNDSAADLYVTRYFSKSDSINQQEILRVFPPSRSTETVSSELHPYCQKEKRRFKLPDLTTIDKHRVIVTTLSTSLLLTDQAMRGHFTHILLDEAGQCLECEAIMPLTLATPTTCVVLAGDHRQLGPKSFTATVLLKRPKLQSSILERLQLYYSNFCHGKQTAGGIQSGMEKPYPAIPPDSLCKMLNVNYRSHPRIMEFVSHNFYSDTIHCRSQWDNFSDFQPLTFYATCGAEMTDDENTSYYNMSEVQEICEQISQLFENWPKSWGERNPQKIAIITPYSQQVKKIKESLLKKNACFKGIRVTTVADVQGDEFHAVFLSTVRTHHGVHPSNEEETFGFFSDIRLLTTALTRAKCQVAVVGDPVSLNSFGRCKNIWRSYLTWCNEDSCLYPKTLTLEEIRLQVGFVKDKLNFGHSPKHQQLLDQDVFDIAEIEADEIIQQLKLKSEPDMAKKQSGENGPHKSFIEIIEDDEHTFFRVSAKQEGKKDDVVYKRKTKWTQVIFGDNRRHSDKINDEGNDDDCEDEDDSSDGGNIYQDHTEEEMLQFLKQDWKKYKRCIIRFEGSQKMSAHNLNRADKLHTIAISSRVKCNRAFDGDEVVVEVITSQTKKGEAPQGRVVGILKRARDLKQCVCRVDPFNLTCFIPLNRGIPRINNLIQDWNKKKGSKATTVTVYSFEKGHIQFIKEEKIDDTNPWNKLFVVHFLKWDAKFFSPLGIVVKVIDAPTGLLDGEIVLQYEYDLREKHHWKTEEEVRNTYPDSYILPESVIKERCDMRNQMTFTIDPQGSKDLDDALSSKKVKDGLFIGIHIADVSYFVQPDSQLEREARGRCLSYYPPNSPCIAMLPARLSAELCSLQPGRERLALSVLLFIDDRNYNDVKRTEVRRTIIRNKHQLKYLDAQRIIENEDKKKWPERLIESVVLLNRVAKVWRSARLGNSSLALDPRDGRNAAAHRLVEEMMVRANHEIASYLMNQYHDIVPLRIQSFPNDESLHEWYLRYQQSTQLSLGLERAVLQLRKMCHCKGPCACDVAPMPPNATMSITHRTLQLMGDALKRQDDVALQCLTTTTVLPPECALAEFDFRDIQERAEYICSVDLMGESAIHASLNVEPYMHFTSPIRRYIDIVAHREVTAALTKATQPYTTKDIRRICDQNNVASGKQRMYEKEVQSLKFNVLLKDQPLVVYPVVTEVEDSRICLRFPTISQVQVSTGKILYSDLNLESLPMVDEQTEQVVLKWDEQVYNYHKWENEEERDSLTTLKSRNIIKLDPNRFAVQIQTSLWQDLLRCVKESNMSRLREKTKEILRSTNISDSAGKQTATARHPVVCEENLQLELTVFKSQVHRVQLASKPHKGKLTPRIQLLTLTDTFDICIEHRQEPIQCFANLTGLKVTRTFKTVKQYLERWQPLLRAEAALDAVAMGDYYLLRGVSIKWTKENDQYTGVMKLATDFCEEIQVFDVDGDTDEEYLCVRYGGIKVPQRIKDDEMVQAAMVEDRVCFVAHCLVKSVDKVKQKTEVKLVLHQSSCPFPEELLRDKHEATIQVINMSLPMRRMMKALPTMEGKEMAKHLALGHRPAELDEHMKKNARKLSRTAPGLNGLVKANEVQQKSVIKALTQSFTSIHGPPGTGKTVTGVRIAYLFSKQNQDEGKHKKVLYCGPSNKSVEVVIDYLKSIKNKDHLELVRVYSEDVVKIKFPVPTKLNPPRRLKSEAEQKNTLKECRHEQFALHLLIRDPSKCPEYSQKIREYDALFRQEIVTMRKSSFKRTKQEKAHWKKKVLEYNGLVFNASKQVLKKADVVLVTCVGAASAKLAEALGDEINQLIIDEAGMCTEPEAIVPLTMCEPKQVVLIGDHMQLEPIVKSELAQRLGMKRSLFERYVKEDDMLTTQYRMHEAIAKFPSDTFYEGKLVCGQDRQTHPSRHQGLWPGGAQYPIVFVDIRGEEMAQVIATADGNEQSKYNPKEARYTAEVVKKLVKRRGIGIDCIQVLSQYRAQCKEIREHLGSLKVDVTTVVKSQGSEVDFVVFSTVRSLPTELIEERPTHGWLRRFLGFIADKHQVNVAITRARKGLIIIGNRELLSTCGVWSQLFQHYQKRKAITSPEGFIKNI